MEITWLGHCAVRIQSTQTAVADPYGAGVGYAFPATAADIVTISRDHPHHANVEGVTGAAGELRVLRGPGEYEIGNFYISGMGTPRSAPDTEERETNTVYTFRCEGLSVCHLGAISQPLAPRQLDELSHTDVLIAPAGGGGAIAVGRAAQLINQINPRIVVPVRYRTPELVGAGADDDLEPLDRLLGELGAGDAQAQAKLVVSATNLPREMKVSPLRPAR